MLESEAFKHVFREYERVRDLHGHFNSNHEGYAVILEEMDELWDTIKGNRGAFPTRKEAIHVGAMAVRFLIDLCPSMDGN